VGHKYRFAILGLALISGAIPLIAPAASAVGESPNLVIDSARTQQSIVFKKQMFTSKDCAYAEQMLTGTGKRTLMRFDVTVYNRGSSAVNLGNPVNNPLFGYSPCHKHYHFSNYALYELFSADPRSSTGQQPVLTGRKQAFCLMDFERDPTVLTPPPAVFTCSNQGLTQGWADTYGSYLDGQWLDITGVKPGRYYLRVTINPCNIYSSSSCTPGLASAMTESSYADNVAVLPVQIPIKIAG
jgi:hypothetical protein